MVGLNRTQLMMILLIDAIGVVLAFLLFWKMEDIRYAVAPIAIATLGMMLYIVLARKGNR